MSLRLVWAVRLVNFEDILFIRLHSLNQSVVYTWLEHNNDVIMNTMASQITSLTIVYSTVYSGADQRKHQSSASLAFVRGIHWWPMNSLHKGPVTRKMFPFDDVIMNLLIPGYSVSSEGSGKSTLNPYEMKTDLLHSKHTGYIKPYYTCLTITRSILWITIELQILHLSITMLRMYMNRCEKFQVMYQRFLSQITVSWL